MTEAEWISSNDPAAMLRSLAARYAIQRRIGKIPDIERLRLFACACCRRVWDILDEEHRRSVEMIEKYVRQPTDNGLRAARRMRWASGNRISDEYDRISRKKPDNRRERLVAWARNIASSAVWEAADKNAAKAAKCFRSVAQAVHALCLSKLSPTPFPEPGYIGYELPADGEVIEQAAILRQIIGNPFATESRKPSRSKKR